MWPTKIDLALKVREPMIELLQSRLSMALDLQLRLKHAHWNIKGPSFIALHELLDGVAEAVEDGADDLAERLVQLGGTAHGLVGDVAKGSTLPKFPAPKDQQEWVEAVAHSLAYYGSEIRTAIDKADEAGDAGTADLFTEISREIDKQLWFVQAHNI